MDKHTFLTGMANLAAIFEKELPEPQLEAYWRILERLSQEDWYEVVYRVGETCERWPSPATILKTLDKMGARKKKRGTWDEAAAGSGGTDLGRPGRIGEALVNAHIAGDYRRIAYYESLIEHMSEAEMMMARKACDSRMSAHQTGDAGALRGYERFKAECERLGLSGLADIDRETDR